MTVGGRVAANDHTVGPPAIGQIRSVQALRAIAALCVVGFHSSLLLHDWFDPGLAVWQNGNSGVDLFFVISGFIMALSSRRLRALADGWRRFAVLRLIRIVPLYWIATLAKLAVVAALPAMALHTRPTPWNVTASFLFVPSRNAAGYIRPIIDVGWTLSFEMLFYAAFTLALFFRAAPLLVVGPSMAVLACLSLARWSSPALVTLASPIAMEFVFGLAVGLLLVTRRRTWSVHVPLCLIGGGFLCLLLIPAGGPWARVVAWGLPAAAVLYGAVAGDRWIGPRLPGLAVRLGEASYSLYLTHGFVIPIVGVTIARSGLQGRTAASVLVAATLGLSSIAALLVYRVVEAPLTDRLRAIAGDRGPGTLAAVRTPL